jgi:hypothetical protein
MLHQMTNFIGLDPSVEDYWRSIILFGKNVACYKFALAKSLLEIAPARKSVITLNDLAEPFSRYVTEHLELCDTQSQNSSKPYPFLEACRQFNRGEITRDELIQTTAKEGFKVVLDKFHNVNAGELPVRFFDKSQRGVSLTDELFQILEGNQSQNLLHEVEARWRLVETAWELNISRGLILYDPEGELLFTRSNRRIDVTSCRKALNGYQKGKCFYCFEDISIGEKALNLADVDHFFPRILSTCGIAHPIDGVWNLVLACQNCNRGVGGKFDQLAHLRYLERLIVRNEFLIDSHHPLRETLIQQTGQARTTRESFLWTNYQAARRGRLINSDWKPVCEKYPPAF